MYEMNKLTYFNDNGNYQTIACNAQKMSLTWPTVSLYRVPLWSQSYNVMNISVDLAKTTQTKLKPFNTSRSINIVYMTRT